MEQNPGAKEKFAAAAKQKKAAKAAAAKKKPGPGDKRVNELKSKIKKPPTAFVRCRRPQILCTVSIVASVCTKRCSHSPLFQILFSMTSRPSVITELTAANAEQDGGGTPDFKPSMGEVSKAIGLKWKQLSEGDKVPFEEQAADRKRQYEVRRASLSRTPIDLQPPTLLRAVLVCLQVAMHADMMASAVAEERSLPPVMKCSTPLIYGRVKGGPCV